MPGKPEGKRGQYEYTKAKHERLPITQIISLCHVQGYYLYSLPKLSIINLTVIIQVFKTDDDSSSTADDLLSVGSTTDTDIANQNSHSTLSTNQQPPSNTGLIPPPPPPLLLSQPGL